MFFLPTPVDFVGVGGRNILSGLLVQQGKRDVCWRHIPEAPQISQNLKFG